MRPQWTLLVLAVACHSKAPQFAGGTFSDGGVAVLRHHENPTRDGAYVEPLFTRAASAAVHVDPAFSGGVTGHVYAQPLYVESAGSSRPDMLIVATESNNLFALDPASGKTIWQRSLGSPAPRSSLLCGDIDPLGITGTPVSDGSTIYLDTMTPELHHLVWALSLADGSTVAGWPVDVQNALGAQGVTFKAQLQNQRGALELVAGTVFVPYGGHEGDCGDYHGWLVGVPVATPGNVRGWQTRSAGGGSWGTGGVASDGSSVYLTTGNTFNPATWEDGEGVLRFSATADLSPADSFAPATWQDLDTGDIDLGGSGPILASVPGATPADVVVAFGKDGIAYVLDRANLGGIGGQLSMLHVSNSPIIQAAAAYSSGSTRYIAFRGRAPSGTGSGCDGTTDLAAITLTAAAPPTPQLAWCAHQSGAGSPIATTTDGSSESMVWVVGAENDERLHGFNGDTGAAIVTSTPLGFVRRFTTPIVARGRIYVGGDDQVYAFTLK